MKNSLKKFSVLLLALVMMMSMLAACGGGSSSSSDSSESAEAPAEEEATAAEPNAGLEGIVFSVPEDWIIQDIVEGHVSYAIPDSRLVLSVNTMSEDDIKEMPDDRQTETIEEYFEKYSKGTKKDQKKHGFDQEEVKMCDSTGFYNKHKIKGSDDYYGLSASCLSDKIVYQFSYINTEAYDDQGQVKDDVEPLTDDEIAAFEKVITSVRKGDGAAVLEESIKNGGIGDISYETPEGYSVGFASDRNVSLEKDGSDVSIQISMTKEEDLAELSEMGEKKYESLDDYYDLDGVSEEDKTTISGMEGFKQIYPGEDGKYYNVNARFRDNDAVYGVYMDSNAYDENGLKEGATSLSDADLETFDAFSASLKQK